jgi:predicted nuclease of predicted toxin-antitoxin system
VAVAFYMDENVRAAITSGLRARGVDVLTAQDDGRTQTPDPDILDRATALGRVVYSEDADFLTEAARRQAAGIPFAGVVYAHQTTPIGTCVSDLELIGKIYDPADMANTVIYLPL